MRSFTSATTNRLVVTGIVLLALAAFGQTPDNTAKFEIADVHKSVPGLFPQMAGGTLREGRYEIRSATMVDLVKTAYGVTDDKVFGGPGWLESDRFDVVAKAPAGTSAQSAKIKLQNLLGERFQLKIHTDNKPVPAYVLTVGKSGHK